MSSESKSVSMPSKLQNRIRGKLASDRIELKDQKRLCAVLRPESGKEITYMLEVTRELGIPLRCEGSPPPKGRRYARLDLSRMSRILDLDPSSRLVVVQAGVGAETLERWLNVHGWTLGWYCPALGNNPISRAFQSNIPSFARKFCGSPFSSIKGYRNILPDGREGWSLPGPHRATGPDLMGLYGSGYGFGLLSQIWIAVYPNNLDGESWSLHSKNLALLLDVARSEIRSANAPNQLIISRDITKKGNTSATWRLYATWPDANSWGNAFPERVRFLGVKGDMVEEIAPNSIDLLAPSAGGKQFRRLGAIDPGLIDALEASKNLWVLSFISGQEFWLWSLEKHRKNTDPVSTWLSKEEKRTPSGSRKLIKALQNSLDSHEHLENRP